jgi:hypothetical protein
MKADIFKKTYAFNEKGEIIPVDSYTDEHYDVSLSIDKDGKPKIERIYGNKRLSELKGALKVFVKAKGHTCLHKSNADFGVTYPSFSQLR